MFQVEKCDICGECLAECQYLDYNIERAQREMKELIDGGCPPVVGNCVTCVACNQRCPTGANPFDLINERQEETGALQIPNESFKKFAALHNLPSRVVNGDPEKPAMNLCIVGNMVQEQLKSSLFEGLTLVEGADFFCALGYVHLGKPGVVERNARLFVDNLSRLGKDQIVCFHDDCYSLLTAKAAEFDIAVPFKPVHLFEYLASELRFRKNGLRTLGIKVAYQAPCASRYTPWKDRFLDEILELVGVERVKRQFDVESGLCCGAPLMARDRGRALKIKKMNISDAAKAGADAMVFLCPMCFLNLRKLCRQSGLRPVFITELCSEALGEKVFDS